MLNAPSKILTHNGCAHSARGLGLVEVMIAMALGLALSAAAATIFVNSRQTYSLQETLSRMQENGRYAIDLITRDLRRAGFWNGIYKLENVTGSEGKASPDGSCALADTSWGRMIDRRIFGLNNTRTGYDCIVASEYLRGDVLVVRYASPAQTTAFNASSLYMRSSPLSGKIFSGDGEAQPVNDVTGMGAAVTRTSRLISHAYFVGSSADSCGAETIPGLYRKTLDNAGSPGSEELVVGVEQLEFEYAVDTDGDGTIDQYLDANTVDTDVSYNWSQVLAAQVWVLVRAECPESGFTDSRSYTMGDQVYTPNDRYRRQLYHSVVVLRN